jgi:hypothetical protein
MKEIENEGNIFTKWVIWLGIKYTMAINWIRTLNISLYKSSHLNYQQEAFSIFS